MTLLPLAVLSVAAVAAPARPALEQLRALAGPAAEAAADIPAPAASAPVSADWDAYARALVAAAGAVDAGRNDIDFRVDEEAADALTGALARATSSVHVEVFQWQADEDGWAVARTLAAEAQAGVRVRVLVDEFGTDADSAQPKKLLDFLRAGGAEVRVRPAPPLDGHLDHRKVVVVDGAAAFVGGMNIGDLYQSRWHDQMSALRGPAVAVLQRAFLAQWRAAGGGEVPEAGLFPPAEPASGGFPTLVVAHRGGGADENIKTAYLRAFAAARRLIRVADPYLTDPEIVAALEAAARRGVDVRLVLPRDNNKKVVQGASRAYYPDLLAAGVQVYEYLPRMAHEKVAVVDDECVLFGSSNLDARSLRDNDELDVVAFGAGLAARVEGALFEPDLRDSERVTSYRPDLVQFVERRFSWLLSDGTAAAAAR